jgi:hypothetical protein
VFRGSDAVRAGLVTKAQLRGPRYLRLFPDVYVRVGPKPPDLTLRSLAAYEYGRAAASSPATRRLSCSTPRAARGTHPRS